MKELVLQKNKKQKKRKKKKEIEKNIVGFLWGWGGSGGERKRYLKKN